QVKNIASLGEVLAISGEKAEVRVGALRLWVATADIRRVSGGQLRKAERKERAFQMDSRPTGPAPKVRTRANTCDLRGQRVEEAMDLVDLFLDQMVRDQQAVAFLLHGHGTGALKEAIRQWLPKSPAVRSYRAAAADEGGDAYTLVELA
ncbi:MAG TPA: Smr/MutS family protein, partial [Myxococcota bacterium]|nr:Smr/MutS family protein [Myxococcota bacterium]